MSGAGRGLEVCVVGGGIAGLAAALQLHEDGHRVTVIAGTAPAPPSGDEVRYYALSPSSTRVLRALGVAELPETATPYRAMCVWGATLRDALRFDLGDAPVGAEALGHIVGHGVLQQALWQRAAAALRLRETTVTAAHRHADITELDCADGSFLAPHLVVAADGAESLLREGAGISVTEWDYAQQGIVANVTTGESLQGTAWQRFLPSGPLALLPTGSHSASIVWSADAPVAEALLAMDDAAFGDALADATQGHLGQVAPASRRVAFPLRVRHAERYCADGLALIGDAAHVIHPLAGQGLNLGLSDGRVLCEQLRERPDNPVRALRTYSRRRRAATADMIALTDALHRLFGAPEKDYGELRDAGMALVNRLAPARAWLVERALG